MSFSSTRSCTVGIAACSPDLIAWNAVPGVFRSGSCRTIVAPAGASLGAWVTGVGEAETCCSLNGTLPNVTVSPSDSVHVSTREPFRKVPLLDPRSRTCTPLSSVTNSAWRREIVGSNTGMSLVGARPTIMGVPALSSNVCRLSALMSLKRMRAGI